MRAEIGSTFGKENKKKKNKILPLPQVALHGIFAVILQKYFGGGSVVTAIVVIWSVVVVLGLDVIVSEVR